jgi:3-methyl-2-oxobutanoate hydroxymethyltransferase
MKECGCNAVKLEGGAEFSETVKALVRASIPVMGHLGLTPQSYHKLGGYSVQGRDDDKRRAIISDAEALVEAGVFSIVLEMVPEELAREVSERVPVPVIGIGAGRFCDGQVLVLNDMLGMNEKFSPKFLKKYAGLGPVIRDAVNSYSLDVKEKRFPEEGHVFK